MTAIEPTGQVLGATVTGVDLSKPLSDRGLRGDSRGARRARRPVLPGPAARRGRAARFLAALRPHPGFGDGQAPRARACPRSAILSNIIENGEPIGLADAGQDWHTDMSYNETVGFTNVLYAVKVPRRDGKPLGATQFANMHAAYDDLDPELKARLRTHDGDARLQQVLGERCGRARAACGRR